ncbi:recombinase family protein [Nostoc sp. FACHB-888]|uniref:recombinase family protein n=1 Tax=Nostoc sp. FACHB-888 TaxID=2692842 RepID=UPI001F549B06|nr:recombinase family protein [Nostoc sp. FACHB-888]
MVNLRRAVLVVLDQSIDLSTSQGKLMVNILGSLAEWEVDMLSERVKHGKQHGRNQQKACEQAPWGYVVQDSKYVLDNSPYLCLIAEDRPKNYHQLKNDDIPLNQLPGRTVAQLGKEFIQTYIQEKSIRGALRFVFNKYGVGRTSAKINSHDRVFYWTQRGFSLWLINSVHCEHTSYLKENKRNQLKSPSEWTTIKDTHPDQRLMTDEEAAEIRYLLSLNKKIGSSALGQKADANNHYREYAYQAGMVFCAECGSKCTVKYTYSQKKRYSYYACRYFQIGCSNSRSVLQEKIEENLIKILVQKSRLLTEVSSLDGSKNSSNSDRVSTLQTKLKAVSEISDSDPDLEKFKQKLRQQIASALNSSSSDYLSNCTASEILRTGNNLAFWHTLSNDEKVGIFPRLVNKIFIHDGEVKSVTFIDE